MNSLQLLPTPIVILALALASSLFLMVDGNFSGPLSSENAPLADVNPQLGTSNGNIAIGRRELARQPVTQQPAIGQGAPAAGGVGFAAGGGSAFAGTPVSDFASGVLSG